MVDFCKPGDIYCCVNMQFVKVVKKPHHMTINFCEVQIFVDFIVSFIHKITS